jgi:uncharacterized protein with HEPN domain
MPKRDDDLLVSDMIECCVNIFEYTNGMNANNFINDRKTVDAVIRNFEVLGEACKRVSEDLRSTNTFIEWKKISDFRNILIHHYFGINYEIMWKIIEEYLPQQYEYLKQLDARFLK